MEEKEYIEVEEIPIREILEKYSTIEKEEKERDGFKCCCPIHKDNTPSFKVYESKNEFYCFGCGVAGQGVDLVRMLNKLGSNEEAEELLRKEYNINEDSIPTVAGLCERKGLSIRVANGMMGWQDTEEGVLLPYLGLLPEQQGENYPTYKIRKRYKGSPKYIKDGKGIVIPYGLNLLNGYDRNKTLYITEGETDLITLLQAGYQVLGIPGATSYNDSWYDYMSSFINICVVMDNDEPGSRLLQAIVTSSKEDSAKIWYMTMPRGIKDINTYHCKHCHKDIEFFKKEFKKFMPVPATLEGFKVVLEEHPEINLINQEVLESYIKYRTQGNRLETDLFLKTIYDIRGKELGISRSTLNAIAKDAVKNLVTETEEAQEAVVTALQEDMIKKEDGYYSYKKLTQSGIIEVPFTSFSVKIEKREELETGEILSTWVLETQEGKINKFTVGAAERASSTEFMKKVNMIDGFMYRVPPIAGFHSMFMYYIEKDLKCPVVKRCTCIGKKGDVWLFNEYGIDSKGNIVYPEHNTYNLDGENYLVPQEAMSKDLYRAKINMETPYVLDKEAVVSLLKTLELNQGSKLAWVVLGWIGACFIKDKINHKGWGFPVCYITGNAQSGKTTLAKWMLKAAGYRTVTALGAKSSMFGINLLASSYSNLPLWFDDIRGLGEEGIWNTIIISSYENSGDIKGTKERTLAQSIDYNSGMLITSEFFVKSPAAGSRCLMLVCDDTTQDRQYLDVIERDTDLILPVVGAQTIVNIQKNILDINDLLNKYRKMLIEHEVSSRFAQNYAVVLLGFKLMFGEYIEESSEMWKEFVEYIVKGTKENNDDISYNSYALELVKDIGTMLQDVRCKDMYKCGEDWVIRDNKLLLKTSKLYETWQVFKRVNQTGDYNTRREFIVQLRRLTFAKRNSAGTAKINGKLVTVVCLDLAEMREHPDDEINLIPGLLEDLDTSEFA